MLAQGQIIRYGPALYRVDFVNDCRAMIVPLAKRHVVLPDGREFEGQRSGINISPNSVVEVITDLDRAKDELELAAIEAELAEARAELARRDAPAPAVTTVTVPRSAPKARRPAAPAGGGWHIAAERPDFKDGTLASGVWEIILGFPGLPTSEIVALAVKAGITGAVAACVSRFNQAGLIEKR